MTQEEKDLLLKDLCARLPYGVIVEDRNGIHELTTWNAEFTDLLYNSKCNIKPYLFPMSSMTEEQREEFDGLIELELKAISDEIPPTQATEFEVDFYNKHHLDWRCLIPMGLAIDATGLNIY